MWWIIGYLVIALGVAYYLLWPFRGWGKDFLHGLGTSLLWPLAILVLGFWAVMVVVEAALTRRERERLEQLAE